MKLIRYHDSSGIAHYGAATENGTRRIEGDPFQDYTITDEEAQISLLLAPVLPTYIIGIGLNYKRHAEESGLPIPDYPVVFAKPPGSAQRPGGPIELPTQLASHKVDYECELAVVIGKPCKNVSSSEALDYVLGYTCANDVSARDWQIEWGGGQWIRGKMFDTFCPLGPAIVTTDQIPDPNDLGIRTILNGETVQDWRTDDMIFNVPEIISFLSGSTTLLPGTVILTGTPHGVGMAADPPRWLKPGDEVTIEIDEIGKLTNRVVEEKG